MINSKRKTKKILLSKILEVVAPNYGGADLDELKYRNPYFGTIMRFGSDKFDDSLEIFRAAK